MHKVSFQIVLITFIVTLLTSCGANPPTSGSSAASAAQVPTDTAPKASSSAAPPEKIKFRLGVFPTPAGEIAAFVRDNLAAEEGLDLEVIELTDGVQLNLGLRDGQFDANLFQHLPYLEDFAQKNDLTFSAITPVFYVRQGIYSKKVKALADVPANGLVTIPADPTNGARALKLLETHGLIKLKPDLQGLARVEDIVENPKNLQIIELETVQIPRSLDDTTIAVINGNVALNAGLKPSNDALVLEDPSVGIAQRLPVVLVTLEGGENAPGIANLVRAFHRPEVKQFIDETYDGAILYVTETGEITPPAQ